MSGLGRQLLAAHRSDLAARIDALGTRVEEVGADRECARQAHSLKGAALVVGLDALAVASAALEAACDPVGGDPPAARRAIALARRALEGDPVLDADVRHDLRSVLNVVIGHASLLDLEPLTPSQRASVAEILAAADAMTAVINGLEHGRAASAAPVAAGPAVALPGASTRVLLVEDDQAAASAVAGMLSSLGSSVTVATAGGDAIRAAAEERPDLVLLDLGLPDADGRDVLRAFRATPALRDVPVVVSSGESGTARARELTAEGATAILPKPVTLDVLRALLAGLPPASPTLAAGSRPAGDSSPPSGGAR